jgi:hypothetical protein
MSEQAEEFLPQWQIEHIKVVARSDREHQALRLALRCREDAARARITSQDLEAAAEGNLIFTAILRASSLLSNLAAERPTGLTFTYCKFQIASAADHERD